jgi:hypothetical protein
MKATVIVDEVGRIVLPKKFLKAIGIFGRTSIHVELVNNAVQVSPLIPPASWYLANKAGGCMKGLCLRIGIAAKQSCKCASERFAMTRFPDRQTKRNAQECRRTIFCDCCPIARRWRG